jgi:hypothetical protein
MAQMEIKAAIRFLAVSLQPAEVTALEVTPPRVTADLAVAEVLIVLLAVVLQAKATTADLDQLAVNLNMAVVEAEKAAAVGALAVVRDLLLAFRVHLSLTQREVMATTLTKQHNLRRLLQTRETVAPAVATTLPVITADQELLLLPTQIRTQRQLLLAAVYHIRSQLVQDIEFIDLQVEQER